MTNKKKYTQIVTPKGEALYAHLVKPEMYQGQDQGFSIQIKLNKKDTEALIATIDKELEKAKQEMDLPTTAKWSKEPFLGYKEDKNGDIVFKFKASSMIKTRTGEELKRSIAVFDSQGNLISGENIGNGSTIRVSGYLMPFYVSKIINGISLKLTAVQVIDLVPYGGGRDAQAYGFAKEEGYVAPAPEEEESEPIEEIEEEEEEITGDF